MSVYLDIYNVVEKLVYLYYINRTFCLHLKVYLLLCDVTILILLLAENNISSIFICINWLLLKLYYKSIKNLRALILEAIVK